MQLASEVSHYTIILSFFKLCNYVNCLRLNPLFEAFHVVKKKNVKPNLSLNAKFICKCFVTQYLLKKNFITVLRA